MKRKESTDKESKMIHKTAIDKTEVDQSLITMAETKAGPKTSSMSTREMETTEETDKGFSRALKMPARTQTSTTTKDPREMGIRVEQSQDHRATTDYKRDRTETEEEPTTTREAASARTTTEEPTPEETLADPNQASKMPAMVPKKHQPPMVQLPMATIEIKTTTSNLQSLPLTGIGKNAPNSSDRNT